ncbi:nucleolin-like [Dorcoceras hygrometricum]|uniref:Nucleolin-like n=1 Tax=Dorcoceras hygrometricum TaxID=472368 RepID=A0A2Z7BJ92_9LAMI|nr:nucleolin-like [Dorcoceras hygrometricum]
MESPRHGDRNKYDHEAATRRQSAAGEGDVRRTKGEWRWGGAMDTASRGPTTIVTAKSQFRTCPSDHAEYKQKATTNGRDPKSRRQLKADQRQIATDNSGHGVCEYMGATHSSQHTAPDAKHNSTCCFPTHELSSGSTVASCWSLPSQRASAESLPRRQNAVVSTYSNNIVLLSLTSSTNCWLHCSSLLLADVTADFIIADPALALLFTTADSDDITADVIIADSRSWATDSRLLLFIFFFEPLSNL